jgi:tetratricopeptide (TPR) repeat protein
VFVCALSATALADYNTSLREGRRLARRGDWAAAMKAFEAALVATPDDAVALSELGFAAFKAGKLDVAKRETRRAVDQAREPNVKAASLYNLGRIDEALNDAASARNDYQQSLALRPNDVVRARLAALSAGAPAGDPLGVAVLDGPKDSPDDVCVAEYRKHTCDLGGAPEAELRPPLAPFVHARVSRTDTDGDGPAFFLLIQTARGWFYRHLLDTQDVSGKWGTRETVTVDELATRPLGPKSAPELLLRYTLRSRTGTDDGVATTTEERWVVCGVSGAGEVSCTDGLRVGLREEGPGRKRALRLKAKLLPDGRAQIEAGGELDADAQKLVGTHKLDF